MEFGSVLSSQYFYFFNNSNNVIQYKEFMSNYNETHKTRTNTNTKKGKVSNSNSHNQVSLEHVDCIYLFCDIVFVNPMLTTLSRFLFQLYYIYYYNIGDQFLINSSRVPLSTRDSVSNGKIDISFSYHAEISGGSLSKHFCYIVRHF